MRSPRERPQDIPNEKCDFSRGFTLEAWIQPDSLRPGRIFDKITAGGTDGFLFDTHPGDTLRLIVGDLTLSAPAGLLKPGDLAARGRDGQSGQRDAAESISTASWSPSGRASRFRRSRAATPCSATFRPAAAAATYPIKFNGSIFTVEPKRMGRPWNADWRAWGDCHWWQNVRFAYHPMLAGGDFEMMDPLFRMYASVRPLCEARAKIYHGVSGCYFPETMTVWGTYSNNDYGWDRTGHQPKDVQCGCWAYAWNQGPELVALMLDRWDYTDDEAFLKEQVLPMAESVLAYFDTRFKRDANGKIVLSPTQAVETVVVDVINDAPTTAGLNNITSRLCALPERLVDCRQRAFFAKMKAACPAVPVEEVEVRRQEGSQTCARREICEAEEQLRESGVVRRFGLSGFTAWASPGWTRPSPPTRTESITSTSAGATTATARRCWA